MRLWLSQITDSIVLVPLMTWAAPANRSDLLFLEPSIHYCQTHLNFAPDLVAVDMAYIHLAMQRRLREQQRVGVVTRLRPDFDIPKHLEPALSLRCRQGQSLRWLGLNPRDHLHWFAVQDGEQPLCQWCWEQSQCPREFSFAPHEHEIVLGTIPVNSIVGRRLMEQVRCWIEASQSHEKNQLGLSAMFLNSLRLTWVACLLADTVCLLRANAMLRNPPAKNSLSELLKTQLTFDLGENLR